ncbi:MAG TPA: universal stress protein [Candidatus Acidoferrum sp.]|nr:universal stress protein [Candidatus Acidoferrum sp.]
MSMNAIESGTRLALNNILFLSDFSDASELALPFALNLARQYESKILALHVLTSFPLAYASPESAAATLEAMENGAQEGCQQLESQLLGLDHQTILMRSNSVWSAVDSVLHDYSIDLVVLGTHGRTGALKLLMGSVAEEIFRKCNTPVLTIGPAVHNGLHNGGRFHTILYATDFSREADAALPYALSLAEESQARLMLLHVLPEPSPKKGPKSPKESVADAMHQMQRLLPKGAGNLCRPEAMVRFGRPSEKILECARDSGADLIVLGVRSPGSRMGIESRFENAIAHRVVTQAICPVLTMRG